MKTLKYPKPSTNGKPKQATLHTSTDHEETAPTYEVVNGGIVWIKRNEKGQLRDVRLCNFFAKIIRRTIIDDGETQHSYLDIEAIYRGRKVEIRDFPISEFESLRWPIDRIDPGAAIEPGDGPGRAHYFPAWKSQVLSDQHR